MRRAEFRSHPNREQNTVRGILRLNGMDTKCRACPEPAEGGYPCRQPRRRGYDSCCSCSQPACLLRSRFRPELPVPRFSSPTRNFESPSPRAEKMNPFNAFATSLISATTSPDCHESSGMNCSSCPPRTSRATSVLWTTFTMLQLAMLSGTGTSCRWKIKNDKTKLPMASASSQNHYRWCKLPFSALFGESQLRPFQSDFRDRRRLFQ